jgi:hypothetical protein
MASQGPNSAGNGSNDTSVGTREWSNPSNIVSSNNTYAIAAVYIGDGVVTSNYLKAQGFSFSIPSGSTIDGILVGIEKHHVDSSFSSHVYDNAVKIVKADGSIGTTNRGDTITHWSTAESYVTYGSSSDKWGESWTAGNINDADFGVVISATTDVSAYKSQGNPYVDHIRITVYYTEVASSSIKSVTGVAQASIKSVTGVAEASINKVNGVAN